MFDDLLARLKLDSWRSKTGFSTDIGPVQDAMWKAPDSAAVASILSTWLASTAQPCLFGRQAAKRDLISFCILTESVLASGLGAVTTQIQRDRERFLADAFEGKKHGFVIVVVSKKLATAVPDESCLVIAKAILAAYLQLDEGAEADKVYHEQIALKLPSYDTHVRLFKGGVNYFSAQGDQRWWHDHRIPGGIAFSVNSVAHMARSETGRIAIEQLMQSLSHNVDPDKAEKVPATKADALSLAMRTILKAHAGPDGVATRLVPPGSDYAGHPFPMPSALSQFRADYYEGYYHTDHSIPKSYFESAVRRPADITAQPLDLTYIWLNSVENPAHRTMWEGVRLRSGAVREAKVGDDAVVPIGELPVLKRAIKRAQS
jgi:hypothetical protein